MKLTVVLTVLIGTLIVACSSAAPAPAEPTPNIEATVEPRIEQERAVDATVEAKAKVEASTPIPRFRDSRGNAAVPELPTMPTPTPTLNPKYVYKVPVQPTAAPNARFYSDKADKYYKDGKYQLAIMNLANTSYTLGFYVGQSARADP